MDKKIILLFTLLGSNVQSASNLSPWLEIKPSYFFCTSTPLKDIYHHGGFELQGSVSAPVCKHLDFYGSIGYRHLSGHALNTDEKTKLTVVPLDIGLKPIFNWGESLYYFLAFGPRFFYFNQHNDSSYVDRKTNRGGVGLFVNTGFNLLFANGFLLGIFGEYSYEKGSISPRMSNVFSGGSIQLGGFAFGLSVGREF